MTCLPLSNKLPEDLQGAIRSIGESSTTAVDTDGDTADQIAESDCDSSPEQRISGVEVALRVELGFGDGCELRGENDGHNHAVNSHDLAENNGNQVLGSDLGCADTAADDRGTGEEDTPATNAGQYGQVKRQLSNVNIPCSSNHRTTNAHRDAEVRPGVRGHLFEEAADLERVMSVKLAAGIASCI